jgi:hypothetical protein
LWWFPAAFLLVFANLTLLAHTKTVKADEPDEAQALQELQDIIVPVATDFEGTSQVLGAEIVADDARPHLVREFLERHNSPMAPYADLIIAEADKNGIDFRLLVAIAMCESNLGKRIPKGSHNAWGIGIYTGENSGAAFDDWPSAIVWVSKYLKEKYYDKGLFDLKDIGAIYAPPSVETEYSWTRCVEKFQNSIN